jgi:signal transduction histidine kinase
MSHDERDEAVEPVERVLLKIVLTFRLLGWIWLVLLVVGAWFTDEDANRTVLLLMGAVTGSWTGLTFWLARTPDRLKSRAFVIADGLVALAAVSASYLAGGASSVYGGYPISWIAVVAYAANVTWALGAGGILFVNQWLAMQLEGTRPLADKIGAVVFLVYAVVVGYAFDLVRQRDRLRQKAEVELSVQRQRRIRHAEQEALADQLHDSVLQTLHAIRVSAADPEQTNYLARRQERELRRTIRSFRSHFDVPFVTAMFAARDDVEELYKIEIDMVCSYDAEMSDALESLVEATREAMINAAKHSGSDTILVYCTAELGSVVVYVRDRGSGFDPAKGGIGFGIENSMVRRLAAIGGTVTIQSNDDFGTEIEMAIPERNQVQ